MLTMLRILLHTIHGWRLFRRFTAIAASIMLDIVNTVPARQFPGAVIT